MKYKDIKDKGFFWLFSINLIMFAADLITTLRMGELLTHLESNLLYKYGGLLPLIILNLLFLAAYYYIYKKGSVNVRFITMFCMVAVIMTRLIAIRGNLMVAADPPTLEQAMAVTQAMKNEVVTRLVLVNVFPLFNGLIAWLFFQKDHKIERK